MTKQEGAVISAYTGLMLCVEFSDFHKYAEDKIGRPVFTHEFADANIWAELKEKSRQEFETIIKNQN